MSSKSNKFRYSAMLMATALTLATMTACGNKGTEQSEIDTAHTTLPVDATMTDLGGVEINLDTTTETTVATTEEATTEEVTEETTEESSEAESGGSGGGGSSHQSELDKELEKRKLKLVPDGDVTSDKVKNLDFGVVTITNKETNIFEGTYRETIDDLNISFNYMGEHKHDTEDFYFDGNEHKGNFAFVYLECLKDGEIFIGHSDDRYNFNDTEIKGLTAVCRNENERNPDEILFYGGIHLNMLREEVEAILGEGVEGCTYTHFDEEFHSVIYKSETTSMVIGYRSQPDIFEEGKFIDFVYEISVIKN